MRHEAHTHSIYERWIFFRFFQKKSIDRFIRQCFAKQLTLGVTFGDIDIHYGTSEKFQI